MTHLIIFPWSWLPTVYRKLVNNCCVIVMCTLICVLLQISKLFNLKTYIFRWCNVQTRRAYYVSVLIATCLCMHVPKCTMCIRNVHTQAHMYSTYMHILCMYISFTLGSIRHLHWLPEFKYCDSYFDLLNRVASVMCVNQSYLIGLIELALQPLIESSVHVYQSFVTVVTLLGDMPLFKHSVIQYWNQRLWKWYSFPAGHFFHSLASMQLPVKVQDKSYLRFCHHKVRILEAWVLVAGKQITRVRLRD